MPDAVQVPVSRDKFTSSGATTHGASHLGQRVFFHLQECRPNNRNELNQASSFSGVIATEHEPEDFSWLAPNWRQRQNDG